MEIKKEYYKQNKMQKTNAIFLSLAHPLWTIEYLFMFVKNTMTLCDPRDGSPPGSPSLGFSRQEHWSGLPFPSPMHESEK